jgi:hypothetical protein
MNKNISFSIASVWLPIAVVITILSGLIYISVQQSYRQNMNDPQIQIAEDIATSLSAGESPQKLIAPFEHIDISKSLSPYVIIVDHNLKPIVSSAELDGKIPLPPAGVFGSVKKYINFIGSELSREGADRRENRVTWQPRQDVRSAIVVIPYTHGTDSGFVLAGRSLREVEVRVQNLTLFVFLAWIASLISSFILIVCFAFMGRKILD